MRNVENISGISQQNRGEIMEKYEWLDRGEIMRSCEWLDRGRRRGILNRGEDYGVS